MIEQFWFVIENNYIKMNIFIETSVRRISICVYNSNKISIPSVLSYCPKNRSFFFVPYFQIFLHFLPTGSRVYWYLGKRECRLFGLQHNIECFSSPEKRLLFVSVFPFEFHLLFLLLTHSRSNRLIRSKPQFTVLSKWDVQSVANTGAIRGKNPPRNVFLAVRSVWSGWSCTQCCFSQCDLIPPLDGNEAGESTMTITNF